MAKKKTRWKVEGFPIREVRPGCFLVRVTRKKDRIEVSETYPTKEQAETFCRTLANQHAEHGKAALELPVRARQDALDALKLLKGRTALLEAARFWTQHHPDTGAVTLAQLGAQWLEELRKQNCRPTTLAERRQKIAKLCLAYGDRPACSITTHDLTGWMDGRGFKAVNRDGYRRCIRAMFNHARQTDIVALNPADRIAPPKHDEKMPMHWDAATVGRALELAEENYPDLVPILAVMFFAGLRPGEAAALTWEQVDIAEGIIRVLPETSKVRRSRLVPLQSNLVLWLGNYRKPAGLVAPAPMTYRRQREALMRRIEADGWRRAMTAEKITAEDAVARVHKGAPTLAKVFTAERLRAILSGKATAGDNEAAALCKVLKVARLVWPRDVTRHTFATFRMADTQDAGKVAAELGHVGGADILYRHYRGLTTPKEAKAFWAIKPSGAAVKLADFAAHTDTAKAAAG
ncbi:MAG: tyrosine-type recombinase/integrase [Kiritimatiellaeota bacterium]|nr:tyrosine-type recombinase/integrase [Kiritimatiellota bacterium]